LVSGTVSAGAVSTVSTDEVNTISFFCFSICLAFALIALIVLLTLDVTLEVSHLSNAFLAASASSALVLYPLIISQIFLQFSLSKRNFQRG
jgi:hypothetical protein